MLLLASSQRHFLFLFIIVVVEFLDPSFHAAQVEGLMTLIAVPESTPLVDWIVTNDALLSPSGELLNKVAALFGQVTKHVDEVLEVVLHGGLVLLILFSPIFFLVVGYLILFLWLLVILFIGKILRGRP